LRSRSASSRAEAIIWSCCSWILLVSFWAPLRVPIFFFSFRKPRRDALLARVHRMHQTPEQKMFQQADQDHEIHDLRRDSEPIDEHGYFETATWFQNGFAKIRMIEMTKQ